MSNNLLHFKSSLSIEEIENNFKDFDFFENLMDGLNEALEFEQGITTTETISRKRSLPSVNVVEIRTSLQMTQKAFATVLGVSCRTVEAWECGKSNPTPTAKKLMYLINSDHSLIKKLVTE